jgi:hypothetical protein
MTQPLSQEELDAQLLREFPLFFIEMNDAQERFIRVKNAKGKTPKRRFFEAGNKIGKTYIGIAEDIAHMMGFRPWLPKDDPDYVIDIAVPNNGLVGCETMMHSVAEKIEPMFRYLVPKICQPVFKPGPTGTCIWIELKYDAWGKKCGSKVHLRSYDQRPDTYEGLDAHFYHWDEPPPVKILTAAERGKVVTNAPSWFTMTPLKEPYILDMFSNRAAIRV